MNAGEPVGGGEANARAGGACLNCGAALLGEYCASCGQRAQIPRSLRTFFADFAASLFNFEGKFWRTLPMLAWCPGDLTRRYIDGQRVRFISPIGLYLFTVFLMFATLGVTGALGDIRFDGSLENTIQAEQARLNRMEAERAAATGRAAVRLDRNIAEARTELDDLRRLTSGDAPAMVADRTGAPQWLGQAVVRAAKDPRGTMTNIQEAASTYSWLLIPLSLPALWLLFPLRRRGMYDHTVFVTYSIAFMMLLVILSGLLAYVGAGAAIPWLLLIPPWHMYRQLKGTYGLSRTGAVARTVLLLFLAGSILIIWGLIVVAVGALS